MLRYLLTLAAAGLVLTVFSHVAVAQTQPSQADLRTAIAATLPPWWSVESVDITASVNDGDAVSPKIRQRFVATATAMAPLFIQAETNLNLGPFVLVVRTIEKGKESKVYGTDSAAFRAGKWVIKLFFEGAPVSGLGRPLSAFDRPAVAVGSEAMKKALIEISGIRKAETDFETMKEAAKALQIQLQDRLAKEASAYLDEKNRALSALQAQLAIKRTAIEASSSVKDDIEQIRKDTATEKIALKSLKTAAQSTSAEIRVQEQLLVSKRKARFDGLIADISAGGTKGLATFAHVIADGTPLDASLAIRIAMQNGDPILQSAALRQIILKNPILAIRIVKQGKVLGVRTYSVKRVAPKTLNFEATNSGFNANGFVSQNTLTINGGSYPKCDVILTITRKGNMKGIADCGQDGQFDAVLDLF